MNKKVVILHPAYWEQAMGGAEIQINYLVSYLVNKGIEVYFIFEDKGTPYCNPLNLNLYPLKKIKLSKRFGNRWFLYHKRIKLLINQIQPDAIYTRFYSSWSGLAAKYAQKANIPHVWALAHDSDPIRQFEKVPLYKFFDRIENVIIEQAFKKAKFIITQNHYQQKAIKEHYQRKGVLITQSAPVCRENTIVKHHDKITIVWIANLKLIKHPEKFLNIVEQFIDNKLFEFIMIGRRSEMYLNQINTLEKKNKQFTYLGEISNDEVNRILLKTDILVNTSEYEGFSNTFVQAWMRKNIVISMKSNPDEILTTHKVGFLIPEIEKIIQTLIELSENKILLNHMAENAFHYARTHHDLNKNLKQIFQLLNL